MGFTIGVLAFPDIEVIYTCTNTPQFTVIILLCITVLLPIQTTWIKSPRSTEFLRPNFVQVSTRISALGPVASTLRQLPVVALASPLFSPRTLRIWTSVQPVVVATPPQPSPQSLSLLRPNQSLLDPNGTTLSLHQIDLTLHPVIRQFPPLGNPYPTIRLISIIGCRKHKTFTRSPCFLTSHPIPPPPLPPLRPLPLRPQWLCQFCLRPLYVYLLTLSNPLLYIFITFYRPPLLAFTCLEPLLPPSPRTTPSAHHSGANCDYAKMVWWYWKCCWRW